MAGANGYAGMTAVHLLARHPDVELTQLTSRSYAGKPYAEVFPLLELKGEFSPEPSIDGVDVIFSCLPHNVGAARVEGWLEAGVRVIDMSADFRLHDASLYPRWASRSGVCAAESRPRQPSATTYSEDTAG